ncbi:MAG TPA: hypothetical protein PK156_26465 [Polyangium sp.]|nr:hypothetical protein [Polyangium sp.]
MADCTPNCTGRVCGDDGCGGSFGDCMTGEACAAVAGMCQPSNQAGTCANPLPLVPAGMPLMGDYLVQGDTTDGRHETMPSCNTATKAPEKIYSLTVTENVAVRGRAMSS